MSARATAATWQETDMSMTDKLVLLALAECADDELCASPSREHLIAMTGGSETTIRRALKELEEAGFIAKAGDVLRPDDKGQSKVVTRYRIVIDRRTNEQA